MTSGKETGHIWGVEAYVSDWLSQKFDQQHYDPTHPQPILASLANGISDPDGDANTRIKVRRVGGGLGDGTFHTGVTVWEITSIRLALYQPDEIEFIPESGETCVGWQAPNIVDWAHPFPTMTFEGSGCAGDVCELYPFQLTTIQPNPLLEYEHLYMMTVHPPTPPGQLQSIGWEYCVAVFQGTSISLPGDGLFQYVWEQAIDIHDPDATIWGAEGYYEYLGDPPPVGGGQVIYGDGAI